MTNFQKAGRYLAPRDRSLGFSRDNVEWHYEGPARRTSKINRNKKLPKKAPVRLESKPQATTAAELRAAEAAARLERRKRFAEQVLAWPGLAWPGLAWPGSVSYSADDETPNKMIQPNTMHFLSELGRNPTEDWFDRHRKDFAFAKRDLLEFVDALLRSASSLDNRVIVANPDHRKCLSGIVSRGVYRSEVSIVFRVSNDAKAIATYFVLVRPEGCYSGGGSRTPPARLARLLRQQMMTDTGRWRNIVEGPLFQKYFPHGLSDGVTTTASKGFAKNHDAMDSLNLRGFGACRPHTDQLMQSGDAISEIAQSFTVSRQLVDFINRATTR